MKFDFLKFFIGFAGGSFLVQMLVIPYPVIGSLFIGLVIGILLEQSTKNDAKGKNEVKEDYE